MIIDFVCPKCSAVNYLVMCKAKMRIFVKNVSSGYQVVEIEDVYSFECNACGHDGNDAALAWLDKIREMGV